MSALHCKRFFHRINRGAINAIGRQNRDFSRLDVLRQQIGLAQCRRVIRCGFAYLDGSLSRRRQSKVLRHALGQLQIDIGENFVHFPGADRLTLNLAQFKAVGRDDVLPFMLTHAVEKQTSLGEVVSERLAALANLVGVDALRITLESSILRRNRRFLWPAAIDGVRLIRRTSLVDGGAVLRIPLTVVER
ncbi:hypothetical protein D3C71_1440340 [compost metagenome]